MSCSEVRKYGCKLIASTAPCVVHRYEVDNSYSTKQEAKEAVTRRSFCEGLLELLMTPKKKAELEAKASREAQAAERAERKKLIPTQPPPAASTSVATAGFVPMATFVTSFGQLGHRQQPVPVYSSHGLGLPSLEQNAGSFSGPIVNATRNSALPVAYRPLPPNPLTEAACGLVSSATDQPPRRGSDGPSPGHSAVVASSAPHADAPPKPRLFNYIQNYCAKQLGAHHRWQFVPRHDPSGPLHFIIGELFADVAQVRTAVS